MPHEPDQTMDLRGTPCPLNWVKAKLRLEEMRSGQKLEILLDEGEPIQNVSRTIKSEGHRILQALSHDNYVQLLIEKA